MIHYRTVPGDECTKLLSVPRVLRADAPVLDYFTVQRHDVMNCHLGQRKLFYSELEFLLILSKRYDLGKVLVVYAGAAPGNHFPLIASLFPDLHFILVDPAPFVISDGPKITIINDFYDDTTSQRIKSLNKDGRHIAFISDIRTAPNDEEIFRNNLAQQRWVVQLDSVAYMLKFRLPYLDDGFHYSKYEYTPEPPLKPPKNTQKGFLYLRGRIYFQLYPPDRSSETRLIGIRRKDQPYRMTYYDIEDYDGQLNYFNCVTRRQRFSFRDSEKVAHHLLGFDDGYESLCEYYLARKYLKRYNHDYGFPDIVRFLYTLDSELARCTHSDLLSCITKGLKRMMQRSQTKETHEICRQYLEKARASARHQIALFAKGEILTREQYDAMTKRAKRFETTDSLL